MMHKLFCWQKHERDFENPKNLYTEYTEQFNSFSL